MKRPKSRAISSREVHRILETTHHWLDEGELSRMISAQVFEFSDGGCLLVFDDGKGRLYHSKDELRAMVEEVARQEPVHMCRGLLPQGRAFAEQVPELIRSLPDRLGLEAAELDYQQASLGKLDKALRRKRLSQVLTAELFAPLTAYVGEVIRKATNGRWAMRLGADAETWEPWIIDDSGRYYAPFAIKGEFDEYGKSASVRVFVAGKIGSNLLGR